MQKSNLRHIRYMKHLIVAVLVIGLLYGCSSQQKNEADAFYEGAAMGYRGIIRVRVGMKNGTITDITVLESREDRAIGGAAIEELSDLVMMYNSTEIDAISGATETSKGFLEALERAILNP